MLSIMSKARMPLHSPFWMNKSSNTGLHPARLVVYAARLSIDCDARVYYLRQTLRLALLFSYRFCFIRKRRPTFLARIFLDFVFLRMRRDGRKTKIGERLGFGVLFFRLLTIQGFRSSLGFLLRFSFGMHF